MLFLLTSPALIRNGALSGRRGSAALPTDSVCPLSSVTVEREALDAHLPLKLE